MKTFQMLCLAFFVASVAGCAPGTGRQDLEGAVTYEGQPVVFGSVHFDPDTKRGGSGVQGAGEIVNGRYKTFPEMGPASGPHIARVTGYARKPETPNDAPLFSEVHIPVDIPANAKSFDLAVPAQKK